MSVWSAIGLESTLTTVATPFDPDGFNELHTWRSALRPPKPLAPPLLEMEMWLGKTRLFGPRVFIFQVLIPWICQRRQVSLKFLSTWAVWSLLFFTMYPLNKLLGSISSGCCHGSSGCWLLQEANCWIFSIADLQSSPHFWHPHAAGHSCTEVLRYQSAPLRQALGRDLCVGSTQWKDSILPWRSHLLL